ncbi:MAG: flagellin [Alphaproteobacteria bacterium]
MARDIALTQGQRQNLAHLRRNSDLFDQTQLRLSTGKKVNSIVDDPVAYFTAKGLSDRSGDFIERKAGIDQAISTLEASLDAVEAIDALLKQMKGLVEATKSQSTVERESATQQFNLLGTQISQLIEDSSYNGLNLLKDRNNQLEVKFSERRESTLTIDGLDLNATASNGSGQLFTAAAFFGSNQNHGFKGVSVFIQEAGAAGFSAMGANNSAFQVADQVMLSLDQAISRLQGQASTLGSNVALLQIRSDFSQAYHDTLAAGADKLVLADMNEEGANFTALSTRQQLGIQALAISGDQASSILTLLR